MKLFLFFSFLILAPGFAFSSDDPKRVSVLGNWVGNGGIVLKCDRPDSSDTSYTALDLMEPDGSEAKADFPPGSILEKVLSMIARVERFHPERAALYRSMALSFFDHAGFADRLENSNDFEALNSLPSYCQPLQAILQISAGPPDSVLYTINKNVWDSLSPDIKATLVLHEILYFEADLLGHRNNSSFVRKYVNAIVTNRMAQFDQDAYEEFMRSLFLAKKYWIDPKTQKKWDLVFTYDMSWSTAIYACRYLSHGMSPSVSEFEDASARLFASAESQKLWASPNSLAFWVHDDDEDYQGYTVDSEGKTLFNEPILNYPTRLGLCIEN